LYYPNSDGLYLKTLTAPTPSPVFDNDKFLKAVTIGADICLNRDDFMIGPTLGLQTTKWNMSINSGLTLRPFAKTVYHEGCIPNYLAYTCELDEGRMLGYLAIEKRLGFNLNISNVGVYGSAKGVYTFGQYRNTKEQYSGRTLFVPGGGLYWMNYESIIKIGYEYVDLDMQGNPYYPVIYWENSFNHRIMISFIYCLNFSPDVDF